MPGSALSLSKNSQTGFQIQRMLFASAGNIFKRHIKRGDSLYKLFNPAGCKWFMTVNGKNMFIQPAKTFLLIFRKDVILLQPVFYIRPGKGLMNI